MKLLIPVLIVFALMFTACDKGSGEASMETKQDSIAYAYGVNHGRQIVNQDIEFSPEAFVQGLKDVQEDGEGALTEGEVRQLIVAFQNEIRKRQMATQQRGNFQPGAVAPEIALSNPDGEVVKLSDLRGNYVLIDFWASWCKPCRAENPNVVRVYNKYKNKGFEILGVSLDRTKDAWTQAIAQDKLSWRHVSDLKFWSSEAARTYKVSSIPYTVLIDPEGKIIAERLRGPSLEAKLEEIFQGV